MKDKTISDIRKSNTHDDHNDDEDRKNISDKSKHDNQTKNENCTDMSGCRKGDRNESAKFPIRETRSASAMPAS